MGPSIAILGTGSHVPAQILSNHELAKMVATSDEWITTRTGIRERRIAGLHEPSSELAVRAAAAAIADARLTAADIDLLVLATVTPDMPMPSTACIVQRKLGLPPGTVCFDLNAACSGFLYALEVARAHDGRRAPPPRPGGRRGKVFELSWTGRIAPPACCSATGPAPSCSAAARTQSRYASITRGSSGPSPAFPRKSTRPRP